MSNTRGLPPAGTYVGKVTKSVRIGQRESKKSGKDYDIGELSIEVNGECGPVKVNGEYDLTVSYNDLEFFEEKVKGTVFIFTVYNQNGYNKLAGLMTKEDVLKALERFAE